MCRGEDGNMSETGRNDNTGGEPSQKAVRARIVFPIRNGVRDDLPNNVGAGVEGESGAYVGRQESPQNINPMEHLGETDARMHDKLVQYNGEPTEGRNGKDASGRKKFME